MLRAGRRIDVNGRGIGGGTANAVAGGAAFVDERDDLTMTANPRLLLLPVILLAGSLGSACERRGASSTMSSNETPPARPLRPRVALRVPGEETIPSGRAGDAVRLGRELALHTVERLPEHVGADLHCTSCHLNAATTPDAGPWVGLSSVFPEYRSRAGRMLSLEERINECFERSMNGKPLAHGSSELNAFVAYIDWLSADVPKGSQVEGRGFQRLERPPNIDSSAGQSEYAARCATCHGVDGAGRHDADGAYFAPPLWGPRSFNVAAGMARLDTAAAFVRHNMPLGQSNTLTYWESYDIAAYFIEQSRPDLDSKRGDWPRGGKPVDARY